MNSASSLPRTACAPLDRERVIARLSGCASLPSLSSMDSALRELLGAEENHTSQIAAIIRRDPSLTARLMRLVNAVHFSKSEPTRNIDEAVFFLGVRQIRQLAMVTQIIEDFQGIALGHVFPWRQFWRHCNATALMTREITTLLHSCDEEIAYVGGLIHDVGKIVMASAFPDHFDIIYHRRAKEGGDLMHLEREVLGVDHAELGAMYLKKQGLADAYVEIVQFHHDPLLARYQTSVTAAVHVSDLMVRNRNLGDSGNHAEVPPESWVESPAWKTLVGHQNKNKQALFKASLHQCLEGIPAILETLV